MNTVSRALVFAFGLLLSISALASALVESFNGDVRAGAVAASATQVATGQRIATGATVVTGPRSLVTLRFDDGQAVLLNENSEFRMTDYVFSREEPARDRYVFDLFRGALRSVTAVLRRNPQAYALRVPQATLGIRGTDFMVVLVNPAFMSVLTGAIEVANAAGAATFSAGATATVATAATLAVPIAAAALPAAVAASFSQMGSIAITAATSTATTTAGTGAAGGSGAGAGAAAGAASGGITLGTAGLIGAAAAAIAAAISSSDDNPTTGTTGTTGTR